MVGTLDRSMVIKYDEHCEIEWVNAFDRVNDEPFIEGDEVDMFSKITSTRGQSILPTDSNTYIVSAARFFYDTTDFTGLYSQLQIYEIDETGTILFDTLYAGDKSFGFPVTTYLNDSVIVIANNAWGIDDGLQVMELNTNYVSLK